MSATCEISSKETDSNRMGFFERFFNGMGCPLYRHRDLARTPVPFSFPSARTMGSCSGEYSRCCTHLAHDYTDATED